MSYFLASPQALRLRPRQHPVERHCALIDGQTVIEQSALPDILAQFAWHLANAFAQLPGPCGVEVDDRSPPGSESDTFLRGSLLPAEALSIELLDDFAISNDSIEFATNLVRSPVPSSVQTR